MITNSATQVFRVILTINNYDLLNSARCFVLIMCTECVLCQVGTEFLYTMQMNINLIRFEGFN